jgi:mannose-1-phosphate guanylyltransferase
LLGAAAERAAVDLGWIVRGERLGVEEDRAFQVHRFVEKPPEPVAMLLLGTGSLWNTFVLAGTASALWKLAGRHIQHQVHAFDAYAPAVGGMDELAARARLYRELMPADFSREVLQVARGRGVVPVLDSGWFDCGTPERLVEYLRATPGLEPLLMRIQNALGRSGPRKAAAAIASAAA